MSTFVKNCVGCQKSKPIPKYRTTLKLSLTGLFDTFSVDLTGPLSLGLNVETYLLITVERLKVWPVVKIGTRDTSYVVLSFVQEELLFSFCRPRYIVSDSTRCFIAYRNQDLRNTNEIIWKTVRQYAPICNGRRERLMRTIKQRGTDRSLFWCSMTYGCKSSLLWISPQDIIGNNLSSLLCTAIYHNFARWTQIHCSIIILILLFAVSSHLLFNCTRN